MSDFRKSCSNCGVVNVVKVIEYNQFNPIVYNQITQTCSSCGSVILKGTEKLGSVKI